MIHWWALCEAFWPLALALFGGPVACGVHWCLMQTCRECHGRRRVTMEREGKCYDGPCLCHGGYEFRWRRR